MSLSRDSCCQPGKTIKLDASVSNSQETAFAGVLVVKIVGLPDQQFERVYQFPAKTSQQFDVCVPIPPSWRDRSHVEFEATLFAQNDSGDQMLDIAGVPIRQSMKIPIDRDPINVSTSFTPPKFSLPWWYWPRLPPDFAYESIIASKTLAGASRNTLGLGIHPIPASHAEWQSLDVLVLNDPEPLKSANNLDSIGRFIDGGGTVWAMLDKVSLETLQPLLSPGHSAEALDSVQLSQLTIDILDGSPEAIGLADRTLKLDRPATLVRVIQQGGEVRYATDGWPVAIIFYQGDGRLIFTTLASSAWIERRKDTVTDTLKETDFIPKLWCANLCKTIITSANRSVYPRGTMGHDQPSFGPAYAHSLIGNPIVPKRTVTITLVSFLLAIAGISTWCWWRGAWQQAVLLTPMVAALFVCVSLFFAGRVRQGVPEMSASLSVSMISSDGNSSVIRQQGAMHLLNQRNLTLASVTNGSAWVESDLVTSGIKRLQYSSLDGWALKNQTWPPGVWGYHTECVRPLESQLAEAVFTSDGLQIRLPNQLATLKDCVFSLQPGQLMLGRSLDNYWLVDGTIPATIGRWTTSTVLDDEQLRRQRVYDELLASDVSTEGRGWRSRLLGWHQPTSLTSWSEEIVQVGSTLEVLPIRLLQPPLQQDVLVPAGSIAISHDKRGLSRSSAFREESGSWDSNASQPTKVALRFSLPDCLTPFHTQSITLSLDISAPRRVVKLWNNSSDPPQMLATLDSPSIPWSETFAADKLTFDDSGALYLLLEVSDRSEAGNDDMQSAVLKWHVNRFSASSTGHRRAQLDQ